MLNKGPISITILSIIAFLAFLFTGMKVGEKILAHPASASQGKTSTTFPDQEDKFLLVIQVEDLSTKKPYLEGVWLINFQSQKPAFGFFPLLPSQADNGMERDQELASAFSLNAENQPASKFFKILSNRNVSWQGYMIIDQWATIEIIDFLGGIDLGEGLQSGIQVIGGMHSRSQNRLLAQHDQANLLQGACRRAAETSQATSQAITFSQLLTSLPRHLSTGDISHTFWEKEWRAMKDMGNIACQTPTLPDLTVK